MIYLISGAASFFIAILASMLGLGGSFLFIPVFTWLGFDYKFTVIPLALLLNTITSLTAQTSYLRKNLTDKKHGLIMAVTAGLFAQLGTYINQYMQANALMLIFSILVAAVALNILFFEKTKDMGYEVDFKVNIAIIVGAGMLAGTMSGLLGVGGGFIIMPALLLIGYPPKRAAATSSFVVFFSSSSSLAGHMATQTIDLKIALVCVVSVFIGAKLGAKLMSEKLSPVTLKKLFGVVMMLIAAKFFFDAL